MEHLPRAARDVVGQAGYHTKTPVQIDRLEVEVEVARPVLESTP